MIYAFLEGLLDYTVIMLKLIVAWLALGCVLAAIYGFVRAAQKGGRD